MSSDSSSEDDILAISVLARKRVRKFWVHPIFQARQEKGVFRNLFKELRSHDEKFREYTRMSQNTFDELLHRVKDDITKKDTNCREAIPATERLLLTLRYAYCESVSINKYFN